MTTNWKIGVDWRRKGVICWEAQPSDALNILPQPIRYTSLDWGVFNKRATRGNLSQS